MWNYVFENLKTGEVIFVRTYDHKNALRIMEEQLDDFNPNNFEFLNKISDAVADSWGYETLTD